MKILQTPPRFYPYTGGVEKYALDLCQELSKKNDVKVICANEPESNLYKIHRITVERLKSFLKIANTNITLSLPFRLLREKFDIIHTYFPTPWSSDWSILISKLKGKKVILSYCNDIAGRGIRSLITNIYNNTFLKFNLHLADRIIIIGPNFLQTSKYLRRYSQKIKFIPIGVNTSLFKKNNIAKEKNSIFFLSILDEFHKYKGLDYLLEAVKIIKLKNQNIKLIVGGKGKMLSFYQEKAVELGIEKNVEFKGFIPEDDLINYYNRSDIFILPSSDASQEGFGIVLLEALACGTPVVTTNIVGIAKDVLDFNTGVVVRPKESHELASAIIKILENEEDYKKNIPILVKKYEINKTAQEIIDVYREVLKK